MRWHQHDIYDANEFASIRSSYGQLWILLQDKRQIDVIARIAYGSPSNAEIAGCALRVAVGRANVIVAVLDGQDVGTAVASDVVGE